jgi:protein-S-isoprenylcysteine O-methyltransferase Ste14
MALREEFERIGQWLFRWRSYLPLLMLGLVLSGLRHFTYPHGSHDLDRLWEFACLAVSLAGIGVRVMAVGCAPKGTSGRNVRHQVAVTLNTTGMYSIVRHPLYAGNFLIGLGISMFPRLWWLSVIFILAFWLYYERIMFAEEEFLRRKFGQSYIAWSARTPAFCPNPARWQPPSVPFSPRWALKREYASLFGVLVTFGVMEAVGDFFALHRLELDDVWVLILAFGVAGYIVVRFLSKQTRLLNVR